MYDLNTEIRFRAAITFVIKARFSRLGFKLIIDFPLYSISIYLFTFNIEKRSQTKEKEIRYSEK